MQAIQKLGIIASKHYVGSAMPNCTLRALNSLRPQTAALFNKNLMMT